MADLSTNPIDTQLEEPGADTENVNKTKITLPTSSGLHDFGGLAVAFAFLAVTFFLFYAPTYLGIPAISTVVALICACIGVGGLGIELDKLSGVKVGWGFGNLGFGLFCGIIWGALYFFFPTWWLDILGLILLFAAAYGTSLGIMEVLTNIATSKISKGATIAKIAIFITQIAAFIWTVLQILLFLKFVK